jgi:hypothetical protein
MSDDADVQTGSDDLPDVELPSAEDVMAEVGSVEPLDGADELAVITDLGYEFCVRYNGRPWIPLHLTANSAGEAAAWAQTIVDRFNQALVAAGYQPLATWTYGPCAAVP